MLLLMQSKTAIECSHAINLLFCPMEYLTTKFVIFQSQLQHNGSLDFKFWWLFLGGCASLGTGCSSDLKRFFSTLFGKVLYNANLLLPINQELAGWVIFECLHQHWADVCSLCQPKFQSRSSHNANQIIEIQDMLIWNSLSRCTQGSNLNYEFSLK